ncbi:MAG: hypothetical protein ACE5SW_05105 [Nitrososphaeraceae archaeon]
MARNIATSVSFDLAAYAIELNTIAELFENDLNNSVFSGLIDKYFKNLQKKGFEGPFFLNSNQILKNDTIFLIQIISTMNYSMKYRLKILY